MNNVNDTNGKPNSLAPSKTPGGTDDRLPMLLGPTGPSPSETQLAVASARLMPIAGLMQELGGTYVGDENGLGESSLCLRVDSTSAQGLATRLLADMDDAGLAPSMVVVEHLNAYYDAKAGCFVYGPVTAP